MALAVAEGEWVGVTGRTGAGKSTLALAAAGLLPRVVRATVNGRVALDDVDALTATGAELLDRVGIVFASATDQLSGSKPTVREELAFGLENLGLPRAEMDDRIDGTMDALGIGHLADRDPGTLSGGEQQRVAIASIAAMGPGLLVLDEPTAELDPAGTSAVVDLLGRLRAAGTTILCAEHDRTVLAASDRADVPRARSQRGRTAGTGRARTDELGRRIGASGCHGVPRPRLVSLPGRGRGAQGRLAGGGGR